MSKLKNNNRTRALYIGFILTLGISTTAMVCVLNLALK